MKALNLEVQREIKSGRTVVGDLIAYYEQHIDIETGKMEFLHVSFLKREAKEVSLEDGTATTEDQETVLHADMEYSGETFRCAVKEQDGVMQFYEVFHQIYNQLKTE